MLVGVRYVSNILSVPCCPMYSALSAFDAGGVSSCTLLTGPHFISRCFVISAASTFPTTSGTETIDLTCSCWPAMYCVKRGVERPSA